MGCGVTLPESSQFVAATLRAGEAQQSGNDQMLTETALWGLAKIKIPSPVTVSATARSVIYALVVKVPKKNVMVRLDANNLTHAVNLEDYRKIVAATDWTLEDLHCGICVYVIALDVMILFHFFVLLFAAAHGKRRR
jgi:hypothetical protein